MCGPGVEILELMEEEEMNKIINTNCIEGLKQLEEDSVDLSFPLQNKSTYSLYLDLYDKIVPNKCDKRFYVNKIEVIMYKKQENVAWINLEKKVEQEESK